MSHNRLDLDALRISGDGPDEFRALYMRMRSVPESEWNGHMHAIREFLQVKALRAILPDAFRAFGVVLLLWDGTIVEHELRAVDAGHAERIAIERELKRSRAVIEVLSVNLRD